MDKSVLLMALKICHPALGNPIVKGLDSFHFRDSTVTAFNGSLLIKAALNEPFPVTGAITGQTLYKLLSELDKEVELSASEDASTLFIKAGRSKTSFPVEAVDPVFLGDAEEVEGEIRLPIKLMFAAGLKRCMQSVGGKGIPQDEVGIHIFIDTVECRMYSTNVMTFSRYVFPVEEGTAVGKAFLPAAFCEQLLLMYSIMDQEPDEIVLSQKYVRARFGNVLLRHSFYANPVNQELRETVDAGLANITVVDLPKDLIDAVRRSEVIAGNTAIQLNFGNANTNKLYLTAKGAKNQELNEEIDLPYPSAGELNIDVRTLKKVIDSCKQIGFGEDYLYLVGNEGFYDCILTERT